MDGWTDGWEDDKPGHIFSSKGSVTTCPPTDHDYKGVRFRGSTSLFLICTCRYVQVLCTDAREFFKDKHIEYYN